MRLLPSEAVRYPLHITYSGLAPGRASSNYQAFSRFPQFSPKMSQIPIKEDTALSLAPPSQSLLLALPAELQLDIYTLVVTTPHPILVNRPCNSSYRGRRDVEKAEKTDWAAGHVRPPTQPALTRTCRAIRSASLPIFYKANVFRASYCYGSKFGREDAVEWLRTIGRANREALRAFYFYDRNERQDEYSPGKLQEVKDCGAFVDMGGRMETLSSRWCCAHLVWFGDWEGKGKSGGRKIAEEEGVPRLRMEGEI
ncbi:hypothetical protein K491DRAFT_699634 [Lophiostoma macrostomum CBS 122681]|uniref:F-box domain-containing protein n=1 Tax=Lophiostoma macrostomum CBS 122681 TaxID=1314788 RepID=A0A6A6SM42_9PLEO|nr:hypothetical protein K491DRAFT_699634 [Lophiostoma macrostomum CBS 122681]